MRIFLEGNIGVGKSSFLLLVKKYLPSVEVAFEAHDAWMKGEGGKTLLAHFYQDPKRWAYMMEVVAMVSRVQEHLRDQKKHFSCKVVERSIYSGHYCFATNDFEQGYMTPAEWKAYSMWVDFLVQRRCNPPSGFIYLRAQPSVCYKRVLKRQRESESQLELEYLEKIHEKHDKFLLKKEEVSENLKKVPVLELDCNADFVSSEEVAREHVKKLGSFLRKVGVLQKRKSVAFEAKTL